MGDIIFLKKYLNDDDDENHNDDVDVGRADFRFGGAINASTSSLSSGGDGSEARKILKGWLMNDSIDFNNTTSSTLLGSSRSNNNNNTTKKPKKSKTKNDGEEDAAMSTWQRLTRGNAQTTDKNSKKASANGGASENRLYQPTESSMRRKNATTITVKVDGVQKDTATSSTFKIPSNYDPRIAIEQRHAAIKEQRAQRIKDQQRRAIDEALKKNREPEASQERSVEHVLPDEDDIARERRELKRLIEEKKNELQQRQEKEREAERLRREIEEKKKLEEELMRIRQEDLKKRKEELKRKADLMVTVRKLKTLQKCFSTWRSLASVNAIEHEKAMKLLAWKRMNKVFHTWKRKVEARQLLRENERLTQQLRQEKEMQDRADRFFKWNTASRFFKVWSYQLKVAKEKKAIRKQHLSRQEKIDSFMKKMRESTAKPVLADDIPEPEHSIPEPIPTSVDDFRIRTARCLEKSSMVNSVVAETSPKLSSPSLSANISNSPSLHRPPKYKQKQSSATPQSQQSTITVVPNPHQSINDTGIFLTAVAQSSELPSSGSHKQETAPQTTGDDKNTTAKGNQTNSTTLAPTVQAPVPTPTTNISRVESEPPKFLTEMEQRNKARQEARKLLQRKYEEAQKEKERKRQEEEQQKLAEELAQKQALIEKKKLEKKLARQKELNRIKRMEEEARMNEYADKQHKMIIARVYGFNPWRRFISQVHQKQQRAITFNNGNVLRRAIREWKQYVFETKKGKAIAQAARISRIRRALYIYIAKLVLEQLKENVITVHQEYAEADRIYQSNLQRKWIRRWNSEAQETKRARILRELENEAKAEELAQRYTRKHYFREWRTCVRHIKLERERAKIKEELWSKAMTFLHEYREQTNSIFKQYLEQQQQQANALSSNSTLSNNNNRLT